LALDAGMPSGQALPVDETSAGHSGQYKEVPHDTRGGSPVTGARGGGAITGPARSGEADGATCGGAAQTGPERVKVSDGSVAAGGAVKDVADAPGAAVADGDAYQKGGVDALASEASAHGASFKASARAASGQGVPFAPCACAAACRGPVGIARALEALGQGVPSGGVLEACGHGIPLGAGVLGASGQGVPSGAAALTESLVGAAAPSLRSRRPGSGGGRIAPLGGRAVLSGMPAMSRARARSSAEAGRALVPGSGSASFDAALRARSALGRSSSGAAWRTFSTQCAGGLISANGS